MTRYEIKKELARGEAIEWQHDLIFNGRNYSYQEFADFGKYFYKKAKRYGLIREFKENGII